LRVGDVFLPALVFSGALSVTIEKLDRQPLLGVVYAVLAAGVAAVLFAEVRVQGGLRVPGSTRWPAKAVGTALILGGFAALTLAVALSSFGSRYENFAASMLAPIYAALCVYYVWLRHRALPVEGV
jgi:predicted permease